MAANYRAQSIGRVRAMSESAASAMPVAFEDPTYREAVVDLLGAIAYGEISAFERLAEDAKLAPTLQDKVALASDGQRRVRQGRAAARADRRAGRRPVRGDGAVPRCRSTSSTCTPRPADWLEGLIKAYVGDGLANDFFREIAAYLDPDTRDLVVVVGRGRRRPLGVRRRAGARGRSPPTRRWAAGWRSGAAG